MKNVLNLSFPKFSLSKKHQMYHRGDTVAKPIQGDLQSTGCLQTLRVHVMPPAKTPCVFSVFIVNRLITY